MSKRVPPPRIYGILAREAPVGVLFRRGPTRRVQVIKWDTERDEFDFGQWLKGRIYERRTDLSPDGKLMIYFAGDMRFNSPSRGTWTAISKPPYLTALAWFPQGDTWGGGGLFASSTHVLINGSRTDERIEPGCPLRFGRLTHLSDADAEIENERMLKAGWITRVGGTLVRPASGQLLQRTGKGSSFRYSLVDEIGSTLRDLPGVTWADVDQRGRIVFVGAGKLYAIEGEAGPSEPRELIDLTNSEFERVTPADWARRW